jgi:hypothetical protein
VAAAVTSAEALHAVHHPAPYLEVHVWQHLDGLVVGVLGDEPDAALDDVQPLDAAIVIYMRGLILLVAEIEISSAGSERCRHVNQGTGASPWRPAYLARRVALPLRLLQRDGVLAVPEVLTVAAVVALPRVRYVTVIELSSRCGSVVVGVAGASAEG